MKNIHNTDLSECISDINNHLNQGIAKGRYTLVVLDYFVIVDNIAKPKNFDKVLVNSSTYNNEIQEFRDHPSPPPFITNPDICKIVVAHGNPKFKLPHINIVNGLEKLNTKDITTFGKQFPIEIDMEYYFKYWFDKKLMKAWWSYGKCLDKSEITDVRPEIDNGSIKITNIIC